jgi:hypothetical protein
MFPGFVSLFINTQMDASAGISQEKRTVQYAHENA